MSLPPEEFAEKINDLSKLIRSTSLEWAEFNDIDSQKFEHAYLSALCLSSSKTIVAHSPNKTDMDLLTCDVADRIKDISNRLFKLGENKKE